MTIIPGLLIWVATKLCGGKQVITIDGKLDQPEKDFLMSVFVKYFGSGVLQQLGVVVLYTLLCLAFGENVVVLMAAALVFSFGFHMPNLLLMFATFGMGQVLLVHWKEYHNLLAIGFAHGVVGSILLYFAPNRISTAFQIWKKYIKTQRGQS